VHKRISWSLGEVFDVSTGRARQRWAVAISLTFHVLFDRFGEFVDEERLARDLVSARGVGPGSWPVPTGRELAVLARAPALVVAVAAGRRGAAGTGLGSAGGRGHARPLAIIAARPCGPSVGAAPTHDQQPALSGPSNTHGAGCGRPMLGDLLIV